MTRAPVIRVRRLPTGDPSLPLPAYETTGAAGADIRACLDPEHREKGIELKPMQRVLVPTGLAVEIPPGHEAQLRPRSGLALKRGLTLLNSPGTIDSDYRGPLGVILANLGEEAQLITHGERIAQLVVAPVVQCSFEIAEELAETERGSGGFGSTGVG